MKEVILTNAKYDSLKRAVIPVAYFLSHFVPWIIALALFQIVEPISSAMLVATAIVCFSIWKTAKWAYIVGIVYSGFVLITFIYVFSWMGPVSIFQNWASVVELLAAGLLFAQCYIGLRKLLVPNAINHVSRSNPDQSESLD